jgi:hypothetical protein
MFLPFVKNDGLIALLCLGVTVMPKVVRERNWKAAAWIMTPSFGVWFGWHMLIKLSEVVACEGRGSSAIYTCKPVGAPEPHRGFSSLNHSGTINVESLGYPVAGNAGWRCVSRESQAHRHVVFLSRQCAFTTLTVPVCVSVQRVAFLRATRKACTSTIVYS